MTENQPISFEQLEALAAEGSKDFTRSAFLWAAEVSRSRLSVLMHEMFEQVDQSLFDAAEEARLEADRKQLAAGLKQLRQRREAISRCFAEQLRRSFEALAMGDPLPEPEEIDPEQPDAPPRRLKARPPRVMAQLESMEKAAAERCFRSLLELDQHLGELRREAKIEAEDNPLSPRSLSRLFQFSVAPVKVGEEAERIIFRMFERYVMSQLGFALDYVNRQLRRVAELEQPEKSKQLNQLFGKVRGLLAKKHKAERQKRQTGEQRAVTPARRAPAQTPSAEGGEGARTAGQGSSAPAAQPEEPQAAPPSKSAARKTSPGDDLQAWQVAAREERDADDEDLEFLRDFEKQAEERRNRGASQEEQDLQQELESDELQQAMDAFASSYDNDGQTDELELPPLDDFEPETEREIELPSIDLDDEGGDDEAVPVDFEETESQLADAPSAEESDRLLDDALGLLEEDELPPLPELEDESAELVRTADILKVLDEMQNELLDTPEAQETGLVSNLGDSAFRRSLMARLHAMRPEYADAVFSEDDEGLVDLVDLVFDFVLHDFNLPRPLQLMLARLQIPYLRAALVDWQLFALSEHPARQLLDELARAAQGWSPEADENREVERRIRTVVEGVMQDFSGNRDLFSLMLDGFSRFMHHFEQRATLAEKRAAEAVRERERLRALRQATAEIRERINRHQVPALIDELLRRAMPEVLITQWLDHGPESWQWKESLGLVDDLVESGRSRKDAEAVQELNSLLPRLMTRLKADLDLLRYEQDRKQQLVRQMEEVYRELLGPELAGQLHMPDAQALPEEPEIEQGEPRADEESLDYATAVELILGVTPEEGEESVSAESVHEALAGSWFEFKGGNGAAVRAKLSWEMPVSGRFLFVDQGGDQVAEKSLSELAAEIRSERAVMLESIPLFERALSAIAQRLQKDSQAESG